MSESIGFGPTGHEGQENLLVERRATLVLAGKFHTIAHRANGAVSSDTNEMYIVTDDHDIPHLSEKIRIVPYNTRTALVSEAFLYLPLDSDFRDEQEHQIVPNIMFFKMRYRGGSSRQAIISEETTWIFEDGEPMHIDTEKLPIQSEKLDIPSVYPTGHDVDQEQEVLLLNEVQQILKDRTRYRLGSQPRLDDLE